MGEKEQYSTVNANNLFTVLECLELILSETHQLLLIPFSMYV